MSVSDPWATIHSNQYGPHGIRKIEKNISDLKAVLQGGDELLDAGCGRGELVKYLPDNINYTGMDLYAERVQEARAANPGFRFMHGNVLTARGEFDVVWSARVVIHLERFKEAIRNLRGIAKRALVLVVELNGDKVTASEMNGDILHTRSFSPETMKSIGECQIITRPQHSYSTVIYR